MRIIHTADWHLDIQLNKHPREAEHRAWLPRLIEVIVEQEADVLLITGDIYDNNNPSGRAMRMLYDFVVQARAARPGLRIIMTSGNHDPAGRLEAPSTLIEALDGAVVGMVHHDGEDIVLDRHLIKINGEDGNCKVAFLAVPFLRPSDLPGLTFAKQDGGGSPIVEAARAFYAKLVTDLAKDIGEAPLICLSHLHAMGAEESEGAERRILIGGEHAVPADVFPARIDYVALGHIHRPQVLAGGRIGYCGSCFPLSATEAGYSHGVTLLEIGEGRRIRREHIEITRPAAFHRLPEAGLIKLDDLPAALEALDLDRECSQDLRPFVHVVLEADGPASVLMTEAERVLQRYPVRNAGIRVVRNAQDPQDRGELRRLSEVDPEELFRAAFVKSNIVEPEDRHFAAFRMARQQAGA